MALGSVEPLKLQAHLWLEESRSQWEAQAMHRVEGGEGLVFYCLWGRRGGGLAILKKLRRFSNRPPNSSYLFRNGLLYILPVVKVNLPPPPTDCCRKNECSSYMLKFTTYLIYSRVYRISVYYLWPLQSISIHARYCFCTNWKKFQCNDPLSEHSSPKPITILKMTPQQDGLPPPPPPLSQVINDQPLTWVEKGENFFSFPHLPLHSVSFFVYLW